MASLGRKGRLKEKILTNLKVETWKKNRKKCQNGQYIQLRINLCLKQAQGLSNWVSCYLKWSSTWLYSTEICHHISKNVNYLLIHCTFFSYCMASIYLHKHGLTQRFWLSHSDWMPHSRPHLKRNQVLFLVQNWNQRQERQIWVVVQHQVWVVD